MCQPGMTALQRQPVLLRILRLLAAPTCGKRFLRHYSGQPALLNWHYAETPATVSRYIQQYLVYKRYKGSAPRAADAARYARARQGRMQLKTDYVKGAEIRGPRLGANSDLIMPRAACAEQIALLCSAVLCVLLLPVLRSDRQYGGNLRGGKNRGA